jgi:tape measure domain-containing protein
MSLREKIKIAITAENKTGGAFNKFKKDVNATNNAIKNLRNQLIAAFGVREIIRAGDAFINIQNRMNALTGSAEETAKAMAHMNRIANESGSDFAAVGNLFTRITIATKEFGITQQNVADAVQTVANTFVISGAEASEAANSARQLAQGLASGALRGDELRSVMENNVVLTRLLADGLGITVGELRDFGKEGKLTAQAILPILVNAVEDTTATVKNMDLTVGQATTRLRTNFTTMLGSLQNATGIFTGLANAIGVLANNIEVLIAVITVLTARAIPAMITALRMLKVALLQNPITASAVAIAAVGTAIHTATTGLGTLDEQIADTLERLQIINETGKARGQGLFGGRFSEITDPKDIENERLRLEALLIELQKLKEEAGKPFTMNIDSVLGNIKELTGSNIQVVKTFAETVEGQLTNAFKKFFDFTSDGFLKFRDLATSVARAVLNELINVFIVQKLVGMISGSIGDIGEAIKFNKLTDGDTLFNPFDGGGYTGMGVRAGGIDGKGGFPAILHPNETVIDHTKGQGMSTTVNFNISTVDAAGFDQLLASRKGLITSIINNAMNNQGKMGVV